MRELAFMAQRRKDVAEGGFYVMRASAGSGKTFRLVETYLACCLRTEDPLKFRRILALTFTNKAVQEMKDRVVGELDGLAADFGSSPYADGLRALTGLDDATLSGRAKVLRRTIQRHFGELSIMTLDKFVGGLVRGFASELQLEHDFSIEQDTDRILDAAIDRVLEQMGRDDDLTDLLVQFVEQAVEDDRDAKVRRQLFTIGSAIEKEQMQPLLKALEDWPPGRFVALQKAMRQEVQAVRSTLRSKARSLLDDLEAAGLEDVMLKWFIRNWLPSIAAGKVDVRGSTLAKGLEGQWARKNDVAGEAAIAPFHDRLVEVAALERAQAKCEEGWAFRTQLMLADWLPLIGTLTALRQASLEIQKEENVRTHGGLNAMIADVVAENPAPFIFERTGERYDHIFIDEFQDTSVIQWNNLAVAVGETLAQGHLSLVVGDAKQAIYRWRNGDHRQLLTLPDLVRNGDAALPPSLSDAEAQMNAAFEKDPLEDNWRSAPQIVAFNNDLYAALGPELGAGLDAVYAGQGQNARKSFDGAVEVEVIEGAKAEERFSEVCKWMETRIRKALEDGFAPGDIALLVRTNREAKGLAEYLLTCNPRIVPFTDESLALGRHPSALAVVHLLELLVDQDTPASLLKFLQAWGAMELEHGRPWDEAQWLADHHEWVAYKRSDDSMGRYGKLNVDALLRKLVPEFDRAVLSALPFGECMGRLLRMLDLDGRYPAHAEALMELTAERAALDQGIEGFLTHWHRKGAQQSIRVLPGPDAVRILTVHKSKGLQYPVVITRFDETAIHKSDTLMPAPLDVETFGVPGVVVPLSVLKETVAHETWELEDARQRFDATNVAYVCTTRAEVRLHVVIDVKSKEWNKEGRPGKVSRMMAKGVEDAFGCNLSDGPWFKGDFALTGPLSGSGDGEVVESRSMDGLVFHGIPDGILAGRREDRRLPVLGRMDAREFGNAVHDVLGRIRTSDEAETVLGRPWPWLRCAEEDWIEVKRAVRRAVHSRAVSRWFDGTGKVHAERDLIGVDGQLRRPDRVVDFGDHIDVLDFKTASEPDAKEREKHAAQVRGYMQALQRPDGPTVNGYVYYLSDDEVVTVEPV